MATVVHPAFPDQKRLVPDDDVDTWFEAGWVKPEKESDELDENIVLTSFEEALLSQVDDPNTPVPAGYAPSLTAAVKED